MIKKKSVQLFCSTKGIFTAAKTAGMSLRAGKVEGTRITSEATGPRSFTLAQLHNNPQTGRKPGDNLSSMNLRTTAPGLRASLQHPRKRATSSTCQALNGEFHKVGGSPHPLPRGVSVLSRMLTEASRATWPPYPLPKGGQHGTGRNTSLRHRLEVLSFI